MAGKAFHSLIQQIIGKASDQKGLHIIDHSICDIVGAEIGCKIPKRNFLVVNLTGFLVSGLVSDSALRMRDAFNFLSSTPLPIESEVHFFPQALLSGFSRVNNLASAVIEQIDSMMRL